jgi:hypothetical protein
MIPAEEEPGLAEFLASTLWRKKILPTPAIESRLLGRLAYIPVTIVT